MLQEEKIAKAIEAIDDCCGHCTICSPSCPVMVARRSMAGLLADIKSAYEEREETDE